VCGRVTSVVLSRLDPSWLGRTVDERFVDEVATSGVDPCGEKRTASTDRSRFRGPVFAHAVGWRRGELRSEAGFSQPDLKPL
jgi:diphthamide synthase (EF-2-diphthine--ammonia ligase)